MKVFHGSYTEIDVIDLAKCEVGRDFGQGFYVTNIRSQAEYWATRKGRNNRMEGFVTEFDFNENICRIMKMKQLQFSGYNEEWLDFVVLNRANLTKQQAHDYDVIEGPVADDDITKRLNIYLNGEISKEQFLIDLTHKSPSHQICFCTVQSLQSLTINLPKAKIEIKIFKIDNEIVKALVKDFEMSQIQATDVYYTSNTYTRLADESTNLYQKPWQEIYQMLKNELKLKA
jgi:hypothetical protein